MGSNVRVREAAARLELTPETVRSLIANGTLKAHKKTLAVNSPCVVDTESVETFDALRRKQEPKLAA